MLSIGALSSAAQGASYYERDGYYAKDDPEHRDASAWTGKGAEELGLKGPVDADTFRAVLEGRVPDGSDTKLGRRGKDGSIEHRPGRDLTFSAPKSVSIAALVGGDRRIVEAHDRAVAATLAWVEKNAAETRMKDPDTGKMGRVGGQKIVAATFRHDTSRNLDPQLHTHAVLANMVQGEDGKWRSMANESLYANQKLIGMLYRNELAAGLGRLGYGIEKTHADGRFEIAGVSREAIEAFSSRRAEIEAAMEERGLGASGDNPRIAERAALMTRAKKRDIDRNELGGVWQRQAADLGLDAQTLAAGAMERTAGPDMQSAPAAADPAGGNRPAERSPDRAESLSGPGRHGPEAAPEPPLSPAAEAIAWAMAHLSERESVFSPHRPVRGRARPCAGCRRDRGRGAGSGGAGEGRNAARRERPGRGRFACDGEDGRRGARDGGADAGRSGARPGSHARLAGAGPPQQGAAHGRAEGRGEADPLGEGPGGGRAGLRRHRQDDHAEPGAGTRGKEGLAHGGPRALGLGGADAGVGGRHSHRNPPDVSRPQCRRGRGQAHEEGSEGDARRLREDDPRGRRGLAGVHGAGKRPAAYRGRAAHAPRGARRRRQAARRGGTPASPSPSSRPPACRPRRWTRSCASAIPC